MEALTLATRRRGPSHMVQPRLLPSRLNNPTPPTHTHTQDGDFIFRPRHRGHGAWSPFCADQRRAVGCGSHPWPPPLPYSTLGASEVETSGVCSKITVVRGATPSVD